MKYRPFTWSMNSVRKNDQYVGNSDELKFMQDRLGDIDRYVNRFDCCNCRFERDLMRMAAVQKMVKEKKDDV